MDELDSAREVIVEAIVTLESAVERLLPAQAPSSSLEEIRGGIDQLKTLAETLHQIAIQAEKALTSNEPSDS